MCPVVLLALLFSFLMLLLEFAAAFNLAVNPPYNITEGVQRNVNFSLVDPLFQNESIYKVISDDPYIADISNQTYVVNEDFKSLNGSFVLRGNFLGITKLRAVRVKNGKTLETSANSVTLKVLKSKRIVVEVFTVCVAVLVSLNYINMGCALDLGVVKSVLKKPIAPIIGFVSQFAMMPLVAYGLAKLLFTDTILRLALFTFGCSPGGGASNMWTVLLKGNLNLSLTMTFISNLAAFGMMPLWLFTLGRTLFSDIDISIPYTKILYPLIIMVIALGIGVALQKYRPNVAKFCRRILAPVSIVMILFIIVFGTYANFYMFKLFTWHIIIAATVNVWLGFLLGAITSKVFHLPIEDVIAIAVETGVQNTGVAYVLLRISLPEPEKDLAAIVPVAGSIMTPIPLLVMYCIQKVRDRCYDNRKKSHMYPLTNDEDYKLTLPSPSSADSITSSCKTNSYVQ